MYGTSITVCIALSQNVFWVYAFLVFENAIFLFPGIASYWRSKKINVAVCKNKTKHQTYDKFLWNQLFLYVTLINVSKIINEDRVRKVVNLCQQWDLVLRTTTYNEWGLLFTNKQAEHNAYFY